MLEKPSIDRPRDPQKHRMSVGRIKLPFFEVLLWQTLILAGYFSDPNATDQLDNALKLMHPTFLLTFHNSANMYIALAVARI